MLLIRRQVVPPKIEHLCDLEATGTTCLQAATNVPQGIEPVANAAVSVQAVSLQGDCGAEGGI